MLSPSFECSLDGLASAVRLRYVVWGAKDAEAKTAVYMDGFRVSEAGWDDPEVIRRRIELIIGDIERVTSDSPTPLTVTQDGHVFGHITQAAGGCRPALN